jgi:hypothetical protein
MKAESESGKPTLRRRDIAQLFAQAGPAEAGGISR